MDVVNAMFLSAVVGAILAAPAVVSEFTRRGKNLPILMDVHACWGKVCSPEEVFVLSIFTHMLISIAFGGIYMFLVLVGWTFHDFKLFTILAYALLFWVFIGAVILPVVQLGFFGRREGSKVWFELLISQVLTGFGFWGALRLFPIFLPT